MEKVISFLKSEGLLCLLIGFFICAFVGVFTGLACTIIMIVCNIIYTKKLTWYNIIGFGCGWALALLQHWFV